MNFEFYCTAEAAARIIGVTVATLRSWRQRGIGPRWVDCYGTPKYPRAAIREFIEQRDSKIRGRLFGNEV